VAGDLDYLGIESFDHFLLFFFWETSSEHVPRKFLRRRRPGGLMNWWRRIFFGICLAQSFIWQRRGNYQHDFARRMVY